jgi:hypothetical protein
MALSYDDKELLLNIMRDSFNRIPGIMRDVVKPSLVLDYIKSIPANFRKYTLEELIDAMEDYRPDDNNRK